MKMLIKQLRKMLKRKPKKMRVVIMEKNGQAFLPVRASETILSTGEKVFVISRYFGQPLGDK